MQAMAMQGMQLRRQYRTGHAELLIHVRRMLWADVAALLKVHGTGKLFASLAFLLASGKLSGARSECNLLGARCRSTNSGAEKPSVNVMVAWWPWSMDRAGAFGRCRQKRRRSSDAHDQHEHSFGPTQLGAGS